ncbi:MAG: MerR family transcriptional regulator, light-induced transcriptional regulator [Solirubrobacteraceae bacterium]|nr:MerR family transcriptional regulator, light-induced transcriptional regulator [Solirubrobacteraceae bacterium]
MDKAGQTVSATSFAQLTGVSRERLRTWERRYGFPSPRRVGDGRRRYHLRDVPRVVAVRRASEEGLPIAAAIASTSYEDGTGEISAEAFAAIVEHAPLPVAAISGPEPLAVAYVNGALGALRGAPAAGEELERAAPALASSACGAQLRALFAGEHEEVITEHPRWDGAAGTSRSVLFRLPVQPDEPPLVAMVGLEAERERAQAGELHALREELAELRERDARHVRWIEAISRLAEEFQVEASAGERDSALDTLVRQLNATDAALAVYLSGQLVVPSSRRGSLGPAMITVTAHPAVARTLRDARPAWLERAAALALGVPKGLHACGIPVVVAGEPLGLVVLLFDEPEEISRDVERLLTAVSAAVGFAMLRDRLADELRDAAAQA